MAKSFAPAPSKVVLSGVEWHENFNCFTAKLGGWLNVGFSYSMDRNTPGYKLSVGGVTLKRMACDQKEAAALVVEAAKRLLKKALVSIESESSLGSPVVEVK